MRCINKFSHICIARIPKLRLEGGNPIFSTGYRIVVHFYCENFEFPLHTVGRHNPRYPLRESRASTLIPALFRINRRLVCDEKFRMLCTAMTNSLPACNVQRGISSRRGRGNEKRKNKAPANRREKRGGVTGWRKSALFPNTCEFDNKLAGSFRWCPVAYPGPAVPRGEKSISPLSNARARYYSSGRNYGVFERHFRQFYARRCELKDWGASSILRSCCATWVLAAHLQFVVVWFIVRLARALSTRGTRLRVARVPSARQLIILKADRDFINCPFNARDNDSDGRWLTTRRV